MVRLMRHPSLKAATQATFFQRLVAFTAMVLLVSVVLFWPSIRNHAGAAFAQANSSAYQPFNCGIPGNSNPQAARVTLPLRNASSSGFASGTAYPCVSGVKWQLSVGCTSCTAVATGTINNTTSGRVIGIISNAFAQTSQTTTMTFGGTTNTVTNLVHLGIQGLQFCSGAGSPALPSGNSGWPCAAGATGIKLTASSTTSQSFQPKTPYNLSITPTGPITVGGSGMMADIWGTPDSTFEVPQNYTSVSVLGLPVQGCGIASGTTTVTNGCSVTLSGFSGSLANLVAGGAVLPLIGVNLTFYYLITHSPNVTDPYNDIGTNNSVILNSTRLTVGDGS